MTIETYQCPQCSAPLIWKNGELVCESCGASYKEEDMRALSEAMQENAGQSSLDWNKCRNAQTFTAQEESALQEYNCPACGAVLVTSAATAASSQSWYCKRQKNHVRPTIDPQMSFVTENGGVFLGKDPDEKVIYLTFDAGYENGCTEPILEALAKHNVKAAFFVVGNYIEQNPELVRRMLREGHIVGNHTYHHYDMSKLSDEAAFNQELTSLETLYRETTGEDLPRYYRPPQGIYSEKNLEMAQKLGYRTVFWSLAYVDWYQDNQPTDEQAFSKLLPRIHPGAVVLLHSTSQTNARILDTLLSKWEEMGYSFGTLDELFA